MRKQDVVEHVSDSSKAVDEAVRTALREPEVLIECLSCSCSRTLRRAFELPRRGVQALMPVQVVVARTDQRLLVYQKRRSSRSGSDLTWAKSMAEGRNYQALQVSGWQRHQLVLLDACKRASVTVVDSGVRKRWFDEDPVGWFTLRLRGEEVKFSYPPRIRRWGRFAGGSCMFVGFLLLFLVAWTLWLFALGLVLLAVGSGLLKVLPQSGDAIERWQAELTGRVPTPPRMPTPSAPARGRLSRLRTRWLLILWAAWLGAAIALGSVYPKKMPGGWAAASAIATLMLIGLTIARVIVGIRARGRPQP
jgi:hypothetical protein